MNQHSAKQNRPEDLIPTRKSLLGRLMNWEDHASWRDFFETYWRLIFNFAVQRGLTHEEAQDVVQETVLAVAKNIARFEYDPRVCAFKTWLLNVTRSKIANQFARRVRHPAFEPTPVGTRCTDSEAANETSEDQCERDELWDREWQKNLMGAAIHRVKCRVSIEQFQMFDLFVLKEWPARDVAKTLRVSVAHVYVAKHRISKLIRKEVLMMESRGMESRGMER